MDLFDQMGARPKGNTPEELHAWMKDYVASQGEAKVKTETSHDVGRLRLCVTFSGDENSKGDCKYDLWRYEVDSLMKENTHSEETRIM